MNYSFSTVLMTVLTSNILIVVIALCFRKQNVILSIGYRLVSLFLILTVIRSIIPFELPVSRNIYFPHQLSVVIAALRHVFFQVGPVGISVWFLIGLIWMIGSLYHIYQLMKRKTFLNRYITRYGFNVTGLEPFRSAMEKTAPPRFQPVHRRPIQIYKVIYSGAPMQFGTLYPCILLPYEMELSEEQLGYVLRHEAAHFYRHDTLIKDVISVICAIYWWNPLSQKLKQQLDLLAEMHVDGAIIGEDSEKRRIYHEVLQEVISQSTADSSLPSLNAAESSKGKADRDLRYRLEMMAVGKKKNLVLLVALTVLFLSIYIASYRFTFEAYYIPPQHSETSDSISALGDDIYAVPQPDGTYDIYIYGIFDTNTDSLTQYRGIPIKQP